MALPLGAILCFLDLLGARWFARGEVRSKLLTTSTSLWKPTTTAPLSLPFKHGFTPLWLTLRPTPRAQSLPAYASLQQQRFLHSRQLNPVHLPSPNTRRRFTKTHMQWRVFTLPRPNSLTHYPTVYGFDILPSVVLLPCHKTRNYVLTDADAAGYPPCRVCTYTPDTCSVVCRETDRGVAGECCCRGALCGYFVK
jgi:hypothetical protein